MLGIVVVFEDTKGFGTVRSETDEEFFFHCTQIADASRAIAVGTAVTFEVVAGHGGRYEAVSLRRRSS